VDQKPNSNNPKIILIVVVILVILCICILVIAAIGYFVYKGNKQAISSQPAPTETSVETTEVVFTITTAEDTAIESSDIDQALKTIGDRCELMEINCVSVNARGGREIVVKVSQDVDLVWFAETIRRVGLVEFVDMGENYITVGDVIHTDYGTSSLPQPDEPAYHTIMTNQDVQSAEVTKDDIGNEMLEFTLTPEGTTIFADHTRSHINQYMAVVLDKRVLVCPVINSEIAGGKGVIAGSFTTDTMAESNDPAQEMNLLQVLILTQPLPFALRWNN